MRRFLIDTDTASDDAVAIVMALRHPDVHVEALTLVAGNVGLDQAVQNALYTVELCGASTPVYRGLAKPIMRTLETAQNIHGEDGMGDCGLPLHGRTPAAGRAVDVLVDTILDSPGEITLVCLGPLSNIAAALLRAPEIATAVGEEVEVLLDGGVRRGSDVVKANALGARGVLIGRAYLWGLAANGQAGVENVLDVIRMGIDATMRGIGVAAIDDLSPADLVVPDGFSPPPFG